MQSMRFVLTICIFAAFFVSFLALSAVSASEKTADNGIIKIQSRYPFAVTIARLKDDIADKKIKFFLEVDQTKLAREAGISLNPSTLIIFGNPPLGGQLISSQPSAGLDWPVRLLITEDQEGNVWLFYRDFSWIARQHNVIYRDEQFKTASIVIASIASSVAAR